MFKTRVPENFLKCSQMLTLVPAELETILVKMRVQISKGRLVYGEAFKNCFLCQSVSKNFLTGSSNALDILKKQQILESHWRAMAFQNAKQMSLAMFIENQHQIVGTN